MEFKQLNLSKCKITSRDLDIFYDQVNDISDILTPYPIIVEDEGDYYNIIYGFEKYLYYQAKDYQKIPAYIRENESLVKKVITICHYQRAQRQLYPIEIARIIKLLQDADVKKQTLATDIADALGINRGYKLVDQYAKLISIPEYIVEFLLDRTNSLKIWSKFIAREESIFASILDLASPSLSEFIEIKKNIYELGMRENKTISALAEELKLKEILQESGNVKEIRKILHAKRNPISTKYRKRLHQIIKKIKTPPNIQIKPDYSLERKSFLISARIQNQNNLEQLKTFLDNKNIDVLRDLLDALASDNHNQK